jgi:drug/metabolite transporter superfamily protein YnfA
VVMALAAFVVNGVFGFTARLELRPVPNEAAVYALLKEAIVEPGGYIANPAVEPGQGFPANQPVFRIHYAGFGHEAAGRLQLFRLVTVLVATTLAAWIVCMASGRVLASYGRRFGFFVLLGLWLVVFSDLPRYDIGGQPWGSAVALGLFDLGLWTLAGAVMAWRLRPEPAPDATRRSA